MKKVITYGTYDTIHYGHLELFRRAKELGQHLTVVVSSDEFNALKGKETIFNLDARIEWLNNIKYIDEVLIEYNWEQKRNDILENNIDIFVMGSDWKGKFDSLKDICEVVYLERTEKISSSEIKKIIRK